MYLSYLRNIMVAELFLRTLVKMYGKHVLYTDEGVWYPDACKSLGLEHRMHSNSIREKPDREGKPTNT
jgi:transposase-like protein